MNGDYNCHVLPRWNLEVIGAVAMNLWPFSFEGSVRTLCWSPQPW